MANFSVDLDSLDKRFPKAIPVPPLLKSFASWVAKQPRSSLGDFETLAGGKFSDDGLSKAANKEIAAATAIFLSFGEGSELALWNHGAGPPAVVLIDSEGEHRTIAASLEAFLDAVSKQKSETELDGKYTDDAPPQRHADLARWLRKANVKVTAKRAPDFAAWMSNLATADASPKPSGLLPPPPAMAARAIAALGKPATDPTLAKLLAELGIDLKKYKTAAAQRFLLVPQHGYALSFEAKRLKSVELANAGYVSWDGPNGEEATFAAFPHEVLDGVRTTDTVPKALEKLGPPKDSTPAAGLYYYEFAGTHCLVKGYDEDVDDKLARDAIRYIKFAR